MEYHQITNLEGFPNLTIESWPDEPRAVLKVSGKYAPPSRGLYKFVTEDGAEHQIYIQEQNYDRVPRVWLNGEEVWVGNRNPQQPIKNFLVFYFKEFGLKTTAAFLVIAAIHGLINYAKNL
ncbi:hypothetical protein KFE80_00275 [bacterium SCSIO 12696]|nr:hypothetical protein KFE80_00275 [bacterium SCSIO 12696]